MKRQIICLWLIVFCVVFLIQDTVQASPDEVTRSPSAEGGQWIDGENAFVSDDAYAVGLLNTQSHLYSEYGFDGVLPEDISIDAVKVGYEHYETVSPQEIASRVSWDGGLTWSADCRMSSESEEMLWVDATDLTDWTRTKLLDANFYVQVKYVSVGVGCFHNDMRVTMDDFSYELLGELERSDRVLSYGNKSQVVTHVVSHNESFGMPFYNVTSMDGRSLIIFGEHEVVVSQELNMKLVADLTLGDSLLSLNGSLIALSSIETVYLREFSNVMVSRGLFYVEDFLVHNLLKSAWSAHLDWLPVNVTYSEIEIGGSAGAGTPSSRINALGAMIYSGVSFLWNGLFFLWTEKIYLPFLLLWTQGKITVEGCLASIFIVLMSYFISKNICNFLFKRKKR